MLRPVSRLAAAAGRSSGPTRAGWTLGSDRIPADTATDRRLIGVTDLTGNMDRDDRDDPFGDFFEEIERMINEMANADAPSADDAGFGSDTHVDAYTTE